MKIDVLKFSTAWAIAAAMLWVLCSLIVFGMPGASMTMSRHMMHSNMGNWAWAFSWTGFVSGLILWALSAFVFGGAIAWIYDKLLGDSETGI